jgi:hypothetical protein
MDQSSPLSWSGPFELYFRYDSESGPPQPIDGLVIWPSLGNAKIKIKGTWKAENDFEFKEVECLEGDCSQIVLWGSYKATLDRKNNRLSGTAVGPMGLTGKFQAKRLRPTD